MCPHDDGRCAEPVCADDRRLRVHRLPPRELTTQAVSTDRPLCGTLGGEWTYTTVAASRPGLPDEILRRILDAFAGRPSNAVQQLLNDVVSSVLLDTPELATLALRFQSEPASTVPADLPGRSGSHAFEVPRSPLGMIDIMVRRVR